MDQSNLLKIKQNLVRNLNQEKERLKIKKILFINTLYEGRKLILNAFKSGIFPIKETQGKGLKISTPKQMFQRLPIALAQAKAGNTSEKLLNEIKQIVYSFYRAKEITRKVYNNIMNSIKV